MKFQAGAYEFYFKSQNFLRGKCLYTLNLIFQISIICSDVFI